MEYTSTPQLNDDGEVWYYLFTVSDGQRTARRDVDASIVRLARDHGDLDELILSIAANLRNYL